MTHVKGKLKVLVERVLGGFRLERETEGSLTYLVGNGEFSEVIKFFKVFEEKEAGEVGGELGELRDGILDWSMSQSSLEEVFMNVVQLNI